MPNRGEKPNIRRVDDDGRYRVTRAGREVFAGNQRALVDAARAGQVRDSDLVFDPSTDNWVFARSHPLLDRLTDATPPPGVPRPARPRREALDASPTPIAGADARRAKRNRAARKRLVGRLLMFFAAIAAVGVWMLVGPGAPGEAMSSYFEEREREQNEPHVPPPVAEGQGGGAAPAAAGAGGPPGGGGAPGGGGVAAAAARTREPPRTRGVRGSAGGGGDRGGRSAHLRHRLA